MKTATVPALRVEPALRQAAEDLLEDGETLSAFTEKALRQEILQRQAQREFIHRGIQSATRARETGCYVTADEVLHQLAEKLANQKTKPAA